MSDAPMTVKGVIHGKTIELAQEPGLPEGQEVVVAIQPVKSRERLAPGEGIRRSVGGWADDPQGLDTFLAWNRRQRKLTRPGIKP